MNDPRVGLITYHSAYNFGSVLQAYATQKTLERLGYPNEIIDYRTPSQTAWYHKDFSWKAGPHNWLTNAGFCLIRKARRRRAEKYEHFIEHYLKLTPERYTCYEQLRDAELGYETLISGSDQVWNFMCGEFRYEPEAAILPYFLDFGHPTKRIAYASSIGGQTLRNVKKHTEQLLRYSALSTREPSGARIIGKALGRAPIEVVADPTWLLTRDDWQIAGTYKPQTKRGYILWYSLSMLPHRMKRWLTAVKEIAKRFDLDVYCISALSYYPDNEVHWLHDAGPLDFLSYLLHASLVITNTFHGTIFPMNCNVPFFSCQAGEGSRQGQMLAVCNLEERIVSSPADLLEITDYACDFTESNRIIAGMRQQSIDYLKNALEK